MNRASMSATVVLSQVMGYYKYEVMEFESLLWLDVINEFGDAAVVNALMAYAKEGSSFAPKVADIRRRLDPLVGDETAALEAVLRAAREVGPYAAPKFTDAAIALAVHAMGGWAAVAGEQAPDPVADPHGYRQFKDRFSAHYKQARATLLLKPNMEHVQLSGIHERSTALPAPVRQALGMSEVVRG